MACAQVLVYFAVAKMGDTPSGGNTELNPEGLTAATGKHAQAVADLFAKGDLSCKVGCEATGWGCFCSLFAGVGRCLSACRLPG